MTPRRSCLAAVFALILLAAWCGGALFAGEAVVRIAVLAYQGADDSEREWSQLAEYLKAAIPDRRFELVHADLETMRELLRNGQVDFVLTNAGQYVELEAELGLSRIVTWSGPDGRSPDRALGSAIIARADRDDLRTLDDLSGRSIAAVAPDAFGGYLVGLRELGRRGIGERDVRTVFMGMPMQRIVHAVARGEVDAGIVRACLIEKLAARGEVDLAQFKTLNRVESADLACQLSTALYPDWPLAKARHTDLALAKAVATALLSMPETPEGTSWGVPADYGNVHELYRELKAGPYSYLRDTTVEALAQRYWPFLLAVFAVIAAVIVHLVRVEHLVKRRTRELTEALRAREMAELRMRKHEEQAEHLSRLSILGELSGTLAHELNQPLTTITTYAQGLKRRIASGRVDVDAFSQANTEIAQQAERAAGIIQRIRAFARKRAAVRESRELRGLVDEALELFTGTMPGAGPVSIEDALPAGTRVRADPLQVQEVLLNLLKNAADATREMPAQCRPIRVRLDRDATWARVQVSDSGPGAAEETQARLFEAFFTTKSEGLGLGLSICKTIVEAHGGRIWAQANGDGPGLTFSFTLPAEADDAR